ncbi:MAG: DUF4416 family protein [Candidatus Omnitrophota bacterium]|jgi:hypothetical protein
MGKAKKTRSVKLIVGMLTRNQKLFDRAEEFFIKKFGPLDYESPALPFNYTDYYKKEMGGPLKRKFISFKKNISPQDIAKIKIFSNSIEKKFSADKKRRINIDPGYISDSKLVLATTKDYFHRIYLQNGIFAEVTLRWRRGGFEPFEWTYPDYRSAEYTGILNHIRNIYQSHAR